MGKSEEFDELMAIEEVQTPSRGRPSHPTGFEPGVKWEGNEGEVVVAKEEGSGEPDSVEFFEKWGHFDPDKHEIIFPLNYRRWQNYDGKWLEYWKADIRLTQDPGDQEDLAYLVEQIQLDQPFDKTPVTDKRALHVANTDLQIGKGREQAGGSRETAMAFIRGIGLLKDFLAKKKRAGEPIQRLYGWWLGDNVEQCTGNYSSQLWRTDLSERKQKRLARRLMIKWHKEMAPLVDEIISVGVASNHGENRSSSATTGRGAMVTEQSDSLDLEIMENTAEVLDENPAYDNVTIVFPEDPMVATLDVYGTIISGIHGHQLGRSSKNIGDKFWEWWADQSMGRLPAGDADILITAHYHHYWAKGEQGRHAYGAPAMDGGSQYFTDKNGRWSKRGILTFITTPDGLEEDKILRPDRNVDNMNIRYPDWVEDPHKIGSD